VSRLSDAQREILPVPDRRYAGHVLYDAKDPDARVAPIRPVRPPAGAPNVLIVLLDDVGFGASSAFGGPCHTPTAERLAAGGLKYTRFHRGLHPLRHGQAVGRNRRTQCAAGWHGPGSPS
jgi:hypothetical protein